MLDTMLARKKTVQERLELNMMLPSAEQIKRDLRMLILQENATRTK